MIIQNKKAYFNYAIEEEIEAGMVLVGSEVKSIRMGKISINESYISDHQGELFLINANISPYKSANNFNHEPTRSRKLLLHQKQIEKLRSKIKIKGYSLIPLKVYFNKSNIAKILIGLGKGKKLHDKRESIKDRDESRRARRGED